MALNKAQTRTATRIVIAVFGVILVIGLAGPSVTGLLGLKGCTTDTGGTDGQGVLDSIAVSYQPSVDQLQAALQSDPASATILVALGNAYFDWAADIQRTEGAPVGADQPYWGFAASFYQRAVDAGLQVPEVFTDNAVSHYYSGDTAGAIEWAERALELRPGFATALFNLGIFYQAAGRSQEALDAFTEYLAADPEGAAGDPALAQQRIQELQSQVGGVGETTATP